ncbi:MAG: hypothetical protein WA667_17945 [Candidatus Nitrosopolaris sp.]
MDGFVMPLEIDSPLKRALEVFEKTRFGFIPILAKNDMMEQPMCTLVSAGARMEISSTGTHLGYVRRF